ncbi:MAG: carboxypeptidase-like regulatory domain-containing protein, partial [Bryobacterales bacterium]|nr:carboxypeptidase-like regulatory domain-containing protein [Bryobacterales bacterium]
MQQTLTRILGIAPLVAAMLLAPTVLGQIESARIQGVVSDSTGAVIPGATVRFVHVDTGQESTVSTGVDGLYRSI